MPRIHTQIYRNVYTFIKLGERHFLYELKRFLGFIGASWFNPGHSSLISFAAHRVSSPP